MGVGGPGEKRGFDKKKHIIYIYNIKNNKYKLNNANLMTTAIKRSTIHTHHGHGSERMTSCYLIPNHVQFLTQFSAIICILTHKSCSQPSCKKSFFYNRQRAWCKSTTHEIVPKISQWDALSQQIQVQHNGYP